VLEKKAEVGKYFDNVSSFLVFCLRLEENSRQVRLRQPPVSDMHACRYELNMRGPPPSKVAAPHVCMFLEARALTESREPLYVRRVRGMGACVLEDAGRAKLQMHVVGLAQTGVRIVSGVGEGRYLPCCHKSERLV
jgi:hypothetical protein